MSLRGVTVTGSPHLGLSTRLAGFVLLFWGCGLVIHARTAFVRERITEAEVERYMARLHS